jgi:polyprenyldihydroxybenzoate methyltransferase/3-demethylubiquinol 3-O-methyltransferase
MQISRVVRALQRQTHSPTTHGTINSSEIAHFSRLSSKWWDEKGEFSFLHKMNPVRVQFIRQKLLEITREEGGEGVSELNNFDGLDMLDVGCGGGLLSEVRKPNLSLAFLC